MVNEKYGIAMCETLQYLKGINQADLNRIPKKFIKFLNDNCSKDYKCKFDYTKPLKELNISDEARGIISVICLNYWCTTEEQKEKFKNHLTENEIKYQEILHEKYNPDNLFKNCKQDVTDEIQPIANEVDMVEYKESIFKRFINKIKYFFSRK